MKFIDLEAQQKYIRSKIEDNIFKVMDHGQYIMGPEVRKLENTLSEYIGSKHAIACSSGTDALLIALMALGVRPGDSILTTPFTFFATAEVILPSLKIRSANDARPPMANTESSFIGSLAGITIGRIQVIGGFILHLLGILKTHNST